MTKHILRFALVLVMIFLPLVFHVSFQVYGVRWRRSCHDVREQIRLERLHRRHLLAERARLRAPSRLRMKAQTLGLAPAPRGRAPVVVARASAPEDGQR